MWIVEHSNEDNLLLSWFRSFSLELAESSPLTIKIFSARPKCIQLMFNKTGKAHHSIENIELNRNYLFVFPVNLSKYLLNENAKLFTIACAMRGNYDVFVRSNQNVRFNIVYSVKSAKSRQLTRFVQISRIRYEKRLQKKQLLLQWDKRYSFYQHNNMCEMRSYWFKVNASQCSTANWIFTRWTTV